MSLDTKVMEEFIAQNESQYIGKYRYHSGYRINDYVFKNHYYMFDENFRQIDIFVEIDCEDRITYVFSEKLHELERKYIINDALKRIVHRLQYPSTLHYSQYEEIVQNDSEKDYELKPINYVDIFNYMKYHQGINQGTMDNYYHIFIPCLERLLKKKDYQTFIQSVHYVLNNILYEHEWNGTNLKYLDTEYQFHLYYIRQIIRMVYSHIDKFYHHTPDELFKVIQLLCQNERFSFMIMTDFGTLVLSHYRVTMSLINTLKQDLVLSDKDEEHANENLVFSYIYYIFKNDFEQYYAVVLKIFRNVVKNMLIVANHDLDLALGNWLIRQEGYQLILDLFDKDYNSFVFTCFPIESFPLELRPKIREGLIAAIQFFAARMKNDQYRLSSFEQVSNLNRLLMDNFKE